MFLSQIEVETNGREVTILTPLTDEAEILTVWIAGDRELPGFKTIDSWRVLKHHFH